MELHITGPVAAVAVLKAPVQQLEMVVTVVAVVVLTILIHQGQEQVVLV